MRRVLRLHPDSRCQAATHIEVEVARPRPTALLLRYVVTGTIDDLLLPPPRAPERADQLWHHSCFEAFLRAPPGTAYHEFNFAPSRHWAAYGFSAYRAGMRVATEVDTPHIDVQSSPRLYALEAALALDGIPSLPGDGAWRLGVSAVIEETSGGKSYWALAHPPGKADFHHAVGFAHDLPATRPA